MNNIPINLYSLEEFNFKFNHLYQNIRQILVEYLIYDEYEYNLLISHSMGYGLTSRQMVKISNKLYYDVHKIVIDNKYSVWSSKLTDKIHKNINDEIKILQMNNEILNLDKIELINHLMNHLNNNLKDELNILLIK